MDAATPATLLQQALRRDPSRPFVTFYDDATGERVELSVSTFDNWVAKTAGFLQDGLAVEPGGRVALLLPPHWQTLVWAMACWTVGAVVVDEVDEEVAVTVTGPDTMDDARTSGADDVVALALRPLGGRFVDPLPAGVLDYAVEVPGWPDRFAAPVPPRPSDPGLVADEVLLTLDGLLARARTRAELAGLEPGARSHSAPITTVEALVDSLLVPLVLDGSAVLVRHEDETRRPARVDAERVTATLS